MKCDQVVGSFIVVLLCLVVKAQQEVCENISLSVKDIQDCRFGICKATATINSFIAASTDRTTCYQLWIENTFVGYLNISAISIFRKQTSEYCYYSDDPFVSYSLTCACNQGAIYGCPNHYRYNGTCPAKLPTTSNPPDYTFCYSEPFMAASSCRQGGFYCGKVGVYLNERFKICKMKAPEPPQILLSIRSNLNELLISYTNEQTQFISQDETIDITIKDFKTTDPEFKDFVIWDKPTTDFFYLSSQYVNNKNEHNSNKIGYWVVDKSTTTIDRTVGANMGDMNWIPVNLLVSDCSVSAGTTYSKAINYATITTMLSNLQSYNVVGQRLPMYLSDTEYIPFQFQNYPSTFDNNKEYWFIKDGLISFRKDNPAMLSFLGMTFGNDLVPITYEKVGALQVKLNDGTTQVLKNAQLRCVFYSDYSVNSSCTQACIASHSTNTSLYGLCKMDSCNFDTTMLNCTDPLLRAITWPDMKRTECSFNRKVTCKKVDSVANTPATLIVNSVEALISMDIELKNMSITFNRYDVQPIISECSFSFLSESIYFNIYSQDGDGDVMIVFSSPSIPAMSRAIRREQQAVIVNAQNITGDIVISVVNGNKNSSCRVSAISKSIILRDLFTNLNAGSLISAIFKLQLGPQFFNSVFYTAMAMVGLIGFILVSGAIVFLGWLCTSK